MPNPISTETAKPPSFWQRHQTPVLLTVVGGAIDTIGFITLFGFFTAHVTGNLVMAGSGLVKGEAGLWIKLAALPLFILTVMVTKIFIDHSKNNKKEKKYPRVNLFLLGERENTN